jgi:hypothetical protein
VTAKDESGKTVLRDGTNTMGRIKTFGILTLLGLAFTACEESRDLELPTPEQVASYYTYQSGLEASLSGNVVEVIAYQPASQLRRGGTLWAKVGPYILLFSDETHQLMEDYPGVAGVRIVTQIRGGPEVARALLARTELSGVLWRRSLNIAGRARLEGTERPSLLEELVRWGEDHTEYEYNPRYTSR